MLTTGAVVVAQLVERLLPIPEVRGSNPVIGKNLYGTFTVNCIEKTKIKKKMPVMPSPLPKKMLSTCISINHGDRSILIERA